MVNSFRGGGRSVKNTCLFFSSIALSPASLTTTSLPSPADDYAEIYHAINQMIPSFTQQIETGEGKEVVVK